MSLSFAAPTAIALPRALPSPTCRRPPRRPPRRAACVALAPPSSRGVLWDCDGVIVESEELHRRAYNAVFAGAGLGAVWSVEFYDMLQNSIGGGKEKMRWYFDKHGWPAGVDQVDFINTLQENKTKLYQHMMSSGQVAPRDGVLDLMDACLDAGIKCAVCSAATKEAVEVTLDVLLGRARLARFDLVLAGAFEGEATRKKPHPMVYNVAAQRLGLRKEDCVVIEDSQIGLQAAVAAGMRCVITHTSSTKSQSFEGADVVVSGLGGVGVETLFPEEG